MSSDDRDQRDPLQSLIAEILEAESRGEGVNREALMAEHSEHADSLREFFASHDQMKSAADVDPPTLPPQSSEPASEDPTIAPTASPLDDPTLLPTRPGGDEPTLAPTEGSPQTGEPTVGDKVRYFGDYELLEEIARGGMGVVYKARQMNLNRVVALKMILSGQFAGEEDVQRFYTEAEAAASLDHPGIVPIFEIGEHAGQHYFSMGYIEGKSLAQRVVDGPLPPQEAAELVKRICDAMAYAHERGVIHRDLKPANILIDSNGQPKVTDFGLAKKTEADSGLTGTGQILGTPAYMPPEQASGKTDEVGPLADVYSLGAILYCLLTGRPPFQAASPMDTLLQVLDREPVAPRMLNSRTPRDLETICLKCLDKKEVKRYASADDLSAELNRFLSGEPIKARPISSPARAWRWCRRKPVVAGLSGIAAFFLIAGTVGVTYFGIEARREAANALTAQSVAEERAAEALIATRRADSKAREAATQKTEAVRLAKELGENLYVSDINRAFRALNDGNMQLLDRLLRRQEPLAGQDDLRGTEFYHLQYELNRFLKQKSFDHGCPIGSFSVSPNGETLVTLGFDNLIKAWDVSTASISNVLEFTKPQPNNSFNEYPTRIVRFSSDGQQVGVFADGLLKLYKFPSWELAITKTIRGSIHAVEFSPDLRRLAVIFSGIAGATLISTGNSQTAELPSATGELAVNGALEFSTDGSLLVASRGIGTTVWELSTGNYVASIGIPQIVWSYAVAIDEKRELVARHRGDRGVHVLELIDLKNEKVFSTYPASRELLRTIAISHDSSLIACAGDDGIVHVFDVANDAERFQFRGHSGLIRELLFHRNGDTIYSASVDGFVREWSVNSDECKMKGISAQYPIELSCSTDGTVVQLRTAGKSRADKRKLVYRWSLATEEAVDGTDTEISFYTNSNERFTSRNGRYKVSKKGLDLHLIDQRNPDDAISKLEGHRATILDWAFAPDSRTLASIAGREIKLWNLATGEELTTIDVGTRPLELVYAPDGTLIVADDVSEVQAFRTSRSHN